MIYYTLHEHNGTELGRYFDCVAKLVQISPVLANKGIRIKFQNIHEIANGERWSTRIIIIKHEREDSEPITDQLLKQLKLEGIKAAKAVLRNRRKL